MIKNTKYKVVKDNIVFALPNYPEKFNKAVPLDTGEELIYKKIHKLDSGMFVFESISLAKNICLTENMLEALEILQEIK